jgi:MFS family permease
VSSSNQNLFALTAATFIGTTGFTLVMPFLPLYFRQLGVEDVGEIALWSGLSLGATPAITALLAPFWGRLGDRFGRKIMVERSLASFVVVMAAMAFVSEAWHVLALRAVQGLFAGYGALAITMAAESVPRERTARSGARPDHRRHRGANRRSSPCFPRHRALLCGGPRPGLRALSRGCDQALRR